MKRLASCVLFSTLILLAAEAREGAVGQMCWTYGTWDNRVYYAENYVHEDRSESFELLMEYTGITRSPTTCFIEEVGDFEERRNRLLEGWSKAGLQPVNTTFLSDLDY